MVDNSLILSVIEEHRAKELAMENLFIEMWDRCDIDSDGYMRYNNEVYFHQDYKNKYLWCDYKLVYLIFIEQFNIKDKDWRTFIKNMLYKHTNCKGLRPSLLLSPHHSQVV